MASNANKKIKGGDLMMFIGGKSIALATSHTLSISGESQDTSNKDEGGGKWSSSEISSLSWEGSSENLFSATGNAGMTYDALFDAMVSMKPVDMVFALKAETTDDVAATGWTVGTSPKYSGSACISSLELNAPNGEYATFSVKFTGVGPLTKTAVGH